MISRNIQRTVGVLLVMIAVLAVRHYRQDHMQIRRGFDRMVELARKRGPESPIAAAARAERFSGWLADKVTVQDVPYAGTLAGRNDVRAAFFQWRALADSIRLEVYDREVDVAPDHLSARLRATVIAEASGRLAGDELVREFEVDWRKIEGKWRVAAVRSVEAIRLPEPR